MPTPPRVNPGDLISSELMNFILGKIVEYENRLAGLESAAGPVSQVRIDRFEPEAQQNAGSDLSIFGSNFAVPASSNIVTLNDIQIVSFLPDSSQAVLKFRIPSTFQPPADGQVTVSVQNNSGRTSVLYRILSFIPPTVPTPVIDTVVSADPPNPIVVNGQIVINGSNFAANPMENEVTFTILANANEVRYPKTGQTIIDATRSTTTRITATLPDITEIQSPSGGVPGIGTVFARVKVGASLPSLAKDFTAVRL